MFHDALCYSCGMHGEKMPEKTEAPAQRKITPASEGGKNPLSVTQIPCLITFGLYSTRDCQEGSRLFTVNPLFRIMTKIAKSTFTTGAGTPEGEIITYFLIIFIFILYTNKYIYLE